ncbi:hypothetical protein VPNG_00156 [Cytospora leucostoma]|uniref:Diphthamide biosynthesis protein 4 n=1 Tax=Cytospora leucostoma TaxID=1230097 RepID=A0A423XNC4_9PEZI|nr:hypothetical protein VPNG_00156 [Cytospora leucostoma]
MTEPTHYEALSLPKSLLEESNKEQIPQIIKQAYHRALLRHHPDKAQTPTPRPASNNSHNYPGSNINTHSSTSSSSHPNYTVDQITRAYTTLSNPAARTLYDRDLILTQGTSSSKPLQSTFQTGIETIDLDDLECSEPPPGSDEEVRWHRSCRCGNERGFSLGEGDLEEAGDQGELIVGCQDCSLWLRVCFAVVEDADGDAGEGEDGGGVGTEKEEVQRKDDDGTGGNVVGIEVGEAAAKQPG